MVSDRSCNCGKSKIATFGLFSDRKKICCSQCKTNLMINLAHPKCKS